MMLVKILEKTFMNQGRFHYHNQQRRLSKHFLNLLKFQEKVLKYNTKFVFAIAKLDPNDHQDLFDPKTITNKALQLKATSSELRIFLMKIKVRNGNGVLGN